MLTQCISHDTIHRFTESPKILFHILSSLLCVYVQCVHLIPIYHIEQATPIRPKHIVATLLATRAAADAAAVPYAPVQTTTESYTTPTTRTNPKMHLTAASKYRQRNPICNICFVCSILSFGQWERHSFSFSIVCVFERILYNSVLAKEAFRYYLSYNRCCVLLSRLFHVV